MKCEQCWLKLCCWHVLGVPVGSQKVSLLCSTAAPNVRGGAMRISKQSAPPGAHVSQVLGVCPVAFQKRCDEAAVREGLGDLGHSWGRIHWGADAGQLVSGGSAVCDRPSWLGVLGLGKKQVRKKREQDLLLVVVLAAKAEEQSWKPLYWRAEP